MQENKPINKIIFISSVILVGLLVIPVGIFAAEEGVDATTEKTITETIEKAAEKAAEKVTEKTVEKALEKAAEKVTEDKIEKAIEKAVEKVSVKPLEQEERPEKWRGPTKINYLAYVIDIDSIDGANQSFSANFYVSIRWHDKRLAEDVESIRQLPLDKVWNPRILIVNQAGKVWETLPKIVEVTPDGTVTYRQRYVGPLSQPLTLSNFPMDEHLFTIQFVAVGYLVGDLEFVPDVIEGTEKLTGGDIAEQLSLTDWEVVNFKVEPRSYEPVKGYAISGLAIDFTARRYFSYYFWQVTAPLLLIVMMSCTVFWINPANASARIGVATSSILTLIAYRFVLAGLLPRLPYMTRMDYFTLGSTLFVFLVMVVIILTPALAGDKHGSRARTIDQFSRLAFPSVFLLMLAWFLSGLL